MAFGTGSPKKGRLLRIHPGFAGTRADDDHLMGAEIVFGKTLIGYVEDLVRDPISQRVRRLITSYGVSGRRVGVPMEWVVSRSPTRLKLAVGAHSLDDLSESPLP